MRLFILGATGRTGVELVDQGLARGHAVTAFVRSPRKIARPHERLTVIEGDPRDASQLRAALPGHDAVLSALGGPDKPRFLGLGANGSGPTTICGDCAHSTVRAMQETGVRRLMVVSVAFLFTDFLPGAIAGNLFFRETVRDAREMEHAVMESALEWTIVRLPAADHGRAHAAVPREGWPPAIMGVLHFTGRPGALHAPGGRGPATFAGDRRRVSVSVVATQDPRSNSGCLPCLTLSRYA